MDSKSDVILKIPIKGAELLSVNYYSKAKDQKIFKFGVGTNWRKRIPNLMSFLKSPLRGGVNKHQLLLKNEGSENFQIWRGG